MSFKEQSSLRFAGKPKIKTSERMATISVFLILVACAWLSNAMWMAFTKDFIDLGNFKNVNHQVGHEAGDKVLRNMTDIVSQNPRRGDMLARWGGEEFLLIVPNTDLAQAQIGLARLRAIGFGLNPNDAPVTARVGIAGRIADQAREWKSLAEMTEQRMYRPNQAGRDQLCSWEEHSVSCSVALIANM